MELTSKMVEDAIEILDTGGWCQGKYEDRNGQHCTIGALRAATQDVVETFIQREALINQLAIRMDVPLILILRQDEVTGEVFVKWEKRSIPHWNDDPAMTKEKVIDALTRVAKGLRDEGK